MPDIDLSGLVFPKLLPGHRWKVERDTDTFQSWDCIEISIIHDRKYFTHLYRVRRLWLEEAREALEKHGYGAEGKEPLPDDEQELWKFYLMRVAEKYHDEYVENNKIPLKLAKLSNAMTAWEDELNGKEPS